MAKDNRMNIALVADGKHTVKIRESKLCKEYDAIDITFRDTEDVDIQVRLFSGYIPRFMAGVKKQSNGATAGMVSSDVINYCKTNAIDIWTSYNDSGYLQASYFPPKA